MMHIKRDGAWLCRKDLGKYKSLYKNDSHYNFNDVHRMKVDEKRFCSECVKKYFSILERILIVI